MKILKVIGIGQWRQEMAKKYPMNYYFLSSALATQLIGQDNANHLLTQVKSGQMEQSEVQVNNVTITSMTQEKVENTILSRALSSHTHTLCLYSSLVCHRDQPFGHGFLSTPLPPSPPPSLVHRPRLLPRRVLGTHRASHLHINVYHVYASLYVLA